MFGQALQVAEDLLINPEIVGPQRAGILNQFFAVGLKGFFWGEKVGERTVEYPASLYDHLLKSLRLRYRKSRATFKFSVYYPDFKLLPSLGRPSYQVGVRYDGFAFTEPPADFRD